MPRPLVLSVIPGYPAFPPEMVFPRTAPTGEPAATLTERGSSRVAYFAGDIDRTLWRSGNADLSRLVQNAVRWVLGDPTAPVVVDGDGMVEIFAWETEARLCGPRAELQHSAHDASVHAAVLGHWHAACHD